MSNQSLDSIDFNLLRTSFSNSDDFVDKHVCGTCRFYLYFNRKVSCLPDVPYISPVRTGNERCVICNQLIYPEYFEERYTMMLFDIRPSIKVKEFYKYYANFEDYLTWILHEDNGLDYMKKHKVLHDIMAKHYYIENDDSEEEV